MSIRRTFCGVALGAGLLVAGAAYAAPQERFENRATERREQIGRDEIRRGEAMEQEGRRLENQGQWRRGQALERGGERLEQRGRHMLNEAEEHEHFRQ